MPSILQFDREAGWRVGEARSQTLAWSSPIIMNRPFSGQPAQMSFIQWNEPIQELPPKTAEQSFAIGIGLGRPNGRFENLNSEVVDRAIQVIREDARSVVDQPAISVVAGNCFSQLLQGPR